MKCELVSVEATDGLELAGLYAAPESGSVRRAILHTHGLAGNFYENRFLPDIGRAAVEKGVAFLVTNNRGHDYRSDNLRGSGLETTYQPGGSTWDIIEDCVHDLKGCADFLTERGHEEIYFEGHSLGCSKTVYYLSETGDSRAAGLILISAPEMFGLQDLRSDGEGGGPLARARELVTSGKGDTLMDIGRDVQYTAATFVSMFGDPSKTDIFPFRHGREGDYRRLASIGSPILATYGDVEEAVNVPIETAAALIEETATGSQRVVTTIIHGANHVYWGHEEELVAAVRDFIEP